MIENTHSKIQSIFYTLLILFFSNIAYSSNYDKKHSLSIHIYQVNISVNYQNPPRPSEILIDFLSKINYKPYNLGSALINISLNSKKALKIEKETILKKLKKLNTTPSKNLYHIINNEKFYKI